MAVAFLIAVLVVLAARVWIFVASTPSAQPSAAVTTLCEQQAAPSPTLTCAAALAAAEAALPAGHPSIVSEDFRWGYLCPPGVFCPIPTLDQGTVIFGFASGSLLVVDVTAGASGAVVVGSPAPYPSY